MAELNITFSQAVEGFMIDKRAERLSRHTLGDYRRSFEKLSRYLDADPPLTEITARTISAFQAYLGETPVAPAGIAPREAKPLSKKTILNVHTALSSLWTWAVAEGYADEHIMQSVPRPRPEEKAVVPYTEKDVKKMLDLCTGTRTHHCEDRADYEQARPLPLRNTAIVLVLLDTGIRASELCDLKVRDVDLQNRHLQVFGKRDKGRSVAFGKRTGKALWRYLVTRKDKQPEDPLFTSYLDSDEPMNRKSLYLFIKRLGRKAGIRPRANVHRFRHTFAITFLRNGGNIYALQEMLGHTSLDMVRRYLRIAQADVDAAHRRASPVDRWRL